MSAPYNKFPAALEAAFVALLQHADAALPATVQPTGSAVAAAVTVTVAKSEDLAKFPRIVVQCGQAKEAIYQSGIYRAPLTITVLTDIDTADASIANSLFAKVADVCQWVDLKERLNALGTVFIHGFGDVTLSPNETLGDRQWQESVQLDVVGFAL